MNTDIFHLFWNLFLSLGVCCVFIIYYCKDTNLQLLFCYIVYFLLVLARKSQYMIFFPFTLHKVFNSFICIVIFIFK